MRIVFMGTPQFAVPSLKALVEAGHEVCGVFSQPDKPVGRHQNKLKPTPVKECALSYQAAGRDIPVYQPEKLRDGTALAILKELAPELIVVAAYGRILPDDILALPPKGCINVHSSLLPKYRGAAPINWAILNGEQETGGHPHPPGGGRGDALWPAGGAGRPPSLGGGGPDRGRDRRPDAPGSQWGVLCPHAVQGAVSGGLEPERPGDPRPDPGPDALAQGVHRRVGRRGGEIVPLPGSGREALRDPGHGAGRRKGRHQCAVRRWQGTSRYRASGAWLPADVCRRLPPGTPVGELGVRNWDPEGAEAAPAGKRSVSCRRRRTGWTHGRRRC